MRICTNCGAQIPDGDLVCPSCGQEVQLVPDYETMESRIQEDLKRKEEERVRRMAEQMRLEKEKRERQKKRNRIILITLFIAAAVIAIVIIIHAVRGYSRENSVSYQLTQAENAYDDGDYADALSHVNKALAIDGKNADTRLLLAKIYIKQSQNDQAVSVLKQLIADDPGNKDAYGLLLKLYLQMGDKDAVRDLMDACQNEGVLKKYADYVAKAPEFSLKEGSYSDIQTVEITSGSEGDIYYTTDGTDPTAASQKYTAAVSLTDGKTELKAVLINKKGIPSKITSAKYTITLEVAGAPKISPSSGQYKSDGSTTTITVEVPDGYTCYYSFDSKPSEKSLKYTGPVAMKYGDHVFYAVLMSKEGKLGKVASATYVYTKATPTPTPAPVDSSDVIDASDTENPVSTPTPEVTATPTPTPEATATPEATPTPTP